MTFNFAMCCLLEVTQIIPSYIQKEGSWVPLFWKDECQRIWTYFQTQHLVGCILFWMSQEILSMVSIFACSVGCRRVF